MKTEEIKASWVELVGEENYSKLRLDENGYSNWACRTLMPNYNWVKLTDKLRPFKTKEPRGVDLLYRPKSLDMKTENYALTEDELQFKCDEYAQSLAKEVVEELRSDTQVYTVGEAAIKSYAINLIKQKFGI